MPGFFDYAITRDGRVFRIKKGPTSSPKEMRLTQGHSHGYLRVDLWRNGRRYKCWVHRLIALAIHGEPPTFRGKTAHVRHLDGDPTNNHADNLVYGSAKDNARDKKRFLRDWTDSMKRSVEE